MSANWIEYKGTDDQIAEMKNAEYGFILRLCHGAESRVLGKHEQMEYFGEFTHYLLCNPHPLADMIIRQAQTGQPVWYRSIVDPDDFDIDELQHGVTDNPNWSDTRYEYSFSPFED